MVAPILQLKPQEFDDVEYIERTEVPKEIVKEATGINQKMIRFKYF